MKSVCVRVKSNSPSPVPGITLEKLPLGIGLVVGIKSALATQDTAKNLQESKNP